MPLSRTRPLPEPRYWIGRPQRDGLLERFGGEGDFVAFLVAGFRATALVSLFFAPEDPDVPFLAGVLLAFCATFPRFTDLPLRGPLMPLPIAGGV